MDKTSLPSLQAILETYKVLFCGNNPISSSLDNAGIQYMKAVKSYEFANKYFGENQKVFNIQSIDILWGLHSRSSDVFLDYILPSVPNLWVNLKKYGILLWLDSNIKLRQLIQKVAMAEFQNNKAEPMNCALFYILLGQKMVVTNLFKLAKDTKLFQFFSRDFNQKEHQVAASKNAFVLLSKRRYDTAVVFFLLANKVEDAINVCLKVYYNIYYISLIEFA